MIADLARRDVLLIGATGALGEAFARALTAAGARVARRRERLVAVAGELPGAVAMPADLADIAGLPDVVGRACAVLGSHRARRIFATLVTGIFTRIPDFQVEWDGVERLEDCGSVDAVRHLPVTFTPGRRRRAAA